MWKSVIYKEWLKIRWITFIFTGIGILAVGNIFLKVQHDFTFHDANNYWYSILYQENQFFNYGLFKFIPLFGALAIAISQFFPEIVNKRIKLTFHLPINENRVLIIMTLFGTACLLIIYMIVLLFFIGLCTLFFPFEIIKTAIISIIPWFLSGFLGYYFTSLIVLEPVWRYQMLYGLVAVTAVPMYLQNASLGGYVPLIPILAGFVILLSISLLFSGYRFRKGEM